MKQGYVYTIVFTFVISAVFSGLLAITNAGYLPTIERNQELALKKAVLDVLAVSPADDAEVEAIFRENITQTEIANLEVYVYSKKGVVEGYAIPMAGPGLWGTIRGYVGVTPNGSEILGVGFTEHSETPGLGGRIDESWYKEQFRALQLGEGTVIAYAGGGENQLDAVTGATATSNAVLRILNRVTTQVTPQLGVNQ